MQHTPLDELQITREPHNHYGTLEDMLRPGAGSTATSCCPPTSTCPCPGSVSVALDWRIKASVSVGWMTTGDYQQLYNVAGAIGTFCLLPGVWDRLDVPDLSIMSAPAASMVVSCSEDPLFPPEGQQEAARQIAEGYAWAGATEKFNDYQPAKPHCYDAEVQAEALAFFSAHLAAQGDLP